MNVSLGFCMGATVMPGLSKLVEEAGEVLQVAGKLIQTGGEAEHWDGSDLLAAMDFFVRHNGLDIGAVQRRAEAKLVKFEQWHAEQGGQARGD